MAEVSEARLDTLHVQIGQLFEANIALSKSLEQHKAAIAERDQIIAALRQQVAAQVPPPAAEDAAPNRAARRAAARGK